MGHNAQNSFFEVACKAGDGYVLVTGSPPRFDQLVSALPCIETDVSASLACRLTDTAPIIAELADYASSSPNRCRVISHRFIVRSPAGNTWFEVACDDGNGLLIRRGAGGMFDALVNCTALPGKCILGKKPG